MRRKENQAKKKVGNERDTQFLQEFFGIGSRGRNKLDRILRPI